MPVLITTYEITIRVSAEAAFDYVADLRTHPQWSGGPLKIEPLAASPAAMGSEYSSVGDLPMQKNRTNRLRITQYARPTDFSFVATDPGFGEVPHRFSFQPVENGTRVTRTVTLTGSAPMLFLLRTVIGPMVSAPMMKKSMARLKANLESQAHDGGKP